jgi:hypothetical protein
VPPAQINHQAVRFVLLTVCLESPFSKPLWMSYYVASQFSERKQTSRSGLSAQKMYVERARSRHGA